MIRRGNLFILCILMYQLLLAGTLKAFNIQISGSAYGIAVSYLLCFVPPLLLYGLIDKPNSWLSLKSISKKNCVLVFLMCLAIQPAMLMLSAISMFFFKNPVGDILSGLSSTPLPVIILIMAVMPAFLEEITLRGVVLRNYQSLPIMKAGIANGVLFGLLHLNPQQFLYAMVLGIVFSYYAYYTESLWAPILGHFTINATQSIIGVVGTRMVEVMPESSRMIVESPSAEELVLVGIVLVVLTVIFLPSFIILFHIFIKYNKGRQVSVSSSQETIIDTSSPVRSEKMFDWTFGAVILFYVLYMAMSYF